MKRSRTMGGRSLWLGLLLGAALAASRPALADTENGARKHAAKANQLAAKNKCTAAIFEFTRALKTLKDPTLLFNRAECFRKVGRTDEAIRDYEQFLVELPHAPNRAAIEARLSALRAGTAGDGGGKAAPKAVPAAAPKEAASAPPRETAPPPKPPLPPTTTANAPAPPPSGDPSAKPAAPPAPPAAATPPAAKPTAPDEKPVPAHKAEKWAD